MKYLNQRAVKSVFKGRKQITKEALSAIDRRIGIYLEKLASQVKERRITEVVADFLKI